MLAPKPKFKIIISYICKKIYSTRPQFQYMPRMYIYTQTPFQILVFFACLRAD